VILLQLKLTKLKLEVLKSDFSRKKEDTNTAKLAIPGKISLKFEFNSISLLLYYGLQ